jgi:hypothetical protein
LPATAPGAPENIEAFARSGLDHNGTSYDYNIDELMGDALTLEGYCSYHANPSFLTESIYSLFCPDDNDSMSHPFDNYGFDGVQEFLVYRFPIEFKAANLPGVKDSIISEIKPIDFCIHAENLQREKWEKHQSASGLKYLTLKTWPSKSYQRKTVTNLDYPRFIDPHGRKRAKWDPMFPVSYRPKDASDVFIIS